MSLAKPFQKATVRAALAAFDRPGRRRYLVADEVGLGKTVVARDVVKILLRRLRRQLVVYYLSSGPVASQNKTRLVDFLPEVDRRLAVRTPDRLALVGVTQPPKSPVALYALTPLTSFPGTKARHTGGRAAERAFIAVLLERAYPSVPQALDEHALRFAARSSWPSELKNAEALFAATPPGLTERFREAIRLEFGIADNPQGRRSVAGRLLEEASGSANRFVGRLRRALCLACLKHQPPDIVILDEFQRYRDLISEEGRKDPLVRQLLKGRSRPPALLLLSATPYRLFATRWEESRGAEAHREFFGLLDFIAGPDVSGEAEVRFKAFGDAVRRLTLAPDLQHDEATQAISKARRLRDELRTLIIAHIGRTEREAFAAAVDVSEPHIDGLPTPLQPGDVAAYRHLVRAVEPRHRPDALSYWSSVPLPAQSLGQRYVISRDRTFPNMRGLATLTKGGREQFKRVGWPSAKLRALGDAAPPRALALPWVGPSLPWWELHGAWQNADDPKLLVFSRFIATPPAVAGLLSFGVEVERIDPRGGYEKAWRRRRLKLAATPNPTMAAFHPCPWLISHTDPLLCRNRTRRALLRHMRGQVTKALEALGIRVDDTTTKMRRRRRPIGQLIAALEQTAGMAVRSANAWQALVGNDHTAQRAVESWRAAPRLQTASTLEVEDLANHALAAPGVVLGRALLRHAPDALDNKSFPGLVRLSWEGLRAYLDNPVLMSTLGGGGVDAILRAVLDGGLESVLDEHLWLRRASHSGALVLAEDLRQALTLITGGFSFQALGNRDRIRLRCHAAMPYNDAEAKAASNPFATGNDEAPPARPVEVQKSFNSPFWPHVLATTSVGQEGLDFHPWCSRVLHWDLPSNPLDLEQREGRIQRFAGLSVRRQLGVNLGPAALAEPSSVSPWRRLAALAETRHGDASGVSPWWVLPGARIRRHVFDQPFGRDAARLRTLREQRFLYRLVLGQPNQEDLLEMLGGAGPDVRAVLRELTLDLCPFRGTSADR